MSRLLLSLEFLTFYMSVRSVTIDLQHRNLEYDAARLTSRTKILFLLLRTLQLLSYAAGWKRPPSKRRVSSEETDLKVERIGIHRQINRKKIPLSVVVPVFNRLESTKRLLDSFLSSTTDFEIIVVDDASSEPIQKMVREYDSLDICYLRSSINRGPASARNIGIKRASHDIVAFTDNDCVVDKDWARTLYSLLNRLPSNVAGIGGCTKPLRRSSIFDSYFDFHQILNPPIFKGSVLYVVTANCCFRKDALIKVGGFDGHIPFPGGEDPGLCFKLHRNGYTLNYCSEAIVFHDFRRSVIDFVRTFYRYGSGCRDQVDRHILNTMKEDMTEGLSVALTS